MNNVIHKRVRLSLREQLLMTERLALYVRSGIPLLETAHLLQEEAHTAGERSLYAHIISTLSEGKPLSTAFVAFPHLFPTLHIELVRMGEASGRLHEYLLHISVLRKERIARNRKIIAALLYPCIIFLCTIGVAGFLALYAFPKMLPLFKGLHARLPLPTRVLIFIHEMVAAHAVFLIMSAIVLCATLIYASRLPQVRKEIERVLLRLPLAGNLIRFYTLALITRTLGELIQSGVQILPALSLVTATTPSPAYREALQEITITVSTGAPLSSGLGAFPRHFSSSVIQLVRSGERTGTLPERLIAIADFSDESLSEITQNLGTLVEPVLMVCMGLIVGFVALAIILPIYGITQSITL